MGIISKYNRAIRLFIHVISWIILFIFPLFFVRPNAKPNYQWLLFFTWIPLIEYMIVFYANYFILTKKLLFKRKYIAFALINIVFILLFLLINGKCHSYLMEMDIKLGRIPDLSKISLPPIFAFVLADLISFFVPIAFAVAVSATERWFKAESESKEVENKNLQSELQHLKYQLQPHFFFNALNNIYSLIEQSPSKAQEAVYSLSKLMRYLLYDTGRDKIDLAKEIDFLRKYIQLMELRHNDRVISHYSFPEDTRVNYPIVPLLFIPIIENAYKHGVSATQVSELYFEMKIEAKELIFISRNTNFPKDKSDKSASGIGLNNLKKRLELLYQGKYELKSGISGKEYFTELKINLQGG